MSPSDPRPLSGPSGDFAGPQGALLTEAEALVAAGRESEALTMMKGAAAGGPNAPVAHHWLGCRAAMKSDLFEASLAFRQAARLDPSWGLPSLNLAMTLDRMGKTREALDAYDDAMERLPNGELRAGADRARSALEGRVRRDETPMDHVAKKAIGKAALVVDPIGRAQRLEPFVAIRVPSPHREVIAIVAESLMHGWCLKTRTGKRVWAKDRRAIDAAVEAIASGNGNANANANANGNANAPSTLDAAVAILEALADVPVLRPWALDAAIYDDATRARVHSGDVALAIENGRVTIGRASESFTSWKDLEAITPRVVTAMQHMVAERAHRGLDLKTVITMLTEALKQRGVPVTPSVNQRWAGLSYEEHELVSLEERPEQGDVLVKVEGAAIAPRTVQDLQRALGPLLEAMIRRAQRPLSNEMASGRTYRVIAPCDALVVGDTLTVTSVSWDRMDENCFVQTIIPRLGQRSFSMSATGKGGDELLLNWDRYVKRIPS